MKKSMLIAGLIFLAVSCAQGEGKDSTVMMNNQQTAVFAGGCFWCMEAAFSGE